MVNQSGYLEREARSLLEKLEAQQRKTQQEIEAVILTLQLCTKQKQIDVLSVAPPMLIRKDLFGTSCREALIKLAKENGGIVKISEVKPILLAAGVLKKTKNTWGAIYTTLSRNGQFEKTDGGGEFRLKGM